MFDPWQLAFAGARIALAHIVVHYIVRKAIQLEDYQAICLRARETGYYQYPKRNEDRGEQLFVDERGPETSSIALAKGRQWFNGYYQSGPPVVITEPEEITGSGALTAPLKYPALRSRKP